MNIYAVLFLFFGLYLSVCIWIFLIITDSVRKMSLRGFVKTKRDFISAVEKHFIRLSENQRIPEDEIVLLCKKLTNKKMQRYFFQRFIFYVDKIQDKSVIKEYFAVAFPFLNDMLRVGRNMHYSELSYRLMLLGEFRQDLEEVNRFIINALEDESFDVRANALRALSVIGNSSYFNKGLIMACTSDKYFNSRHISEMAGSFEGNVDELKLLMMDSFYANSDFYRYQVIVFLTEKVKSSSMDFILKYLKDNLNDKELVIACLRYFSASEVDEGAKKIILKLLYTDDFEIKAIAVRLTPKYFIDDEEIVLLLLGERFLKSKDWYVRRNSAAALVKFGLDKEDMLKYLINDDKYAREALIYAMFDAGITNYNELIELGGDLSGISA